MLARRVMDAVIGDVARAIRKLGAAGVERFVVSADHGHLFARLREDDMKTDSPGGDTVDLHRRCWIGRGHHRSGWPAGPPGRCADADRQPYVERGHLGDLTVVFLSTPARDALDDKVNRIFAGKVVRKDLVRKVKVGANVPVFVLEYLLGKYCASSDEMSIQMGMQVVNDTLADNYIRPDEAQKAQSKVKEQGRHTFIDKVRVRLVDSQYWAEVTNFGHRYVRIPDRYVRDYDRLLTGGIWAQVDVRWEYDEETKGKYPFWIDQLSPIQLATFDLDEFRRLRSEFTADEWIDLMIRSMGYEPSVMDRRLKLLFLVRLIPLCEANFNLVELGPRGTGKSYAVQEISPYAALLTGPTTVANLFGQQQGRYKGMVQIWDTIGFDEVADLQKMPKEVITTLKTYCESGQFQRGQEALSGYASIAMFGNTQQPVDVMVQTGHLFAPLPDIIRDDMAFIDRLHFYLPGWEVGGEGERENV
jgi:ATP-dependent Lon protease